MVHAAERGRHEYITESTYFKRSDTFIEADTHFSLMMIKMINNIFNSSAICKCSPGGFVAAVFDNCTFVENCCADNGICFIEMAYLLIRNCRINLFNQYCTYGCVM